MKKFLGVLTLVLGCGGQSWAVTPTAATTALQSDYQKIGLWFSDQFADAMAYNAASGTNMPANVAKLPGFELGVTFGVTASEIDTDALSQLGTSVIDTTQVDVYSRLPVPVGVAHVKVGLPWGMDLGGKFGSYTLSADKEDSNFSFKNAVWGIELRKALAEDGLTRPFGLALGVSLDGNNGRITYDQPYNTPTTYQGDTVTPDVTNRITSDASVRTVGAKVTVSKNLLIVTPFAGLGLNKNFGSVRSTIRSFGNVTTTGAGGGTQAVDVSSVAEAKANDVDTRLFAGIEMNILLLKLGISAEYAGKDVAGNIGLRFQFH